MTAPSSSRVIRDVAATPFQFAPITSLATTSPEPASGFVPWDTPRGDGPAEPQTTRDEVFERGFAAGRAEAEAAVQAQLDALRAEAAETEAAHAAALDALESRTRETAERLSAEWARAVRALEPRLVDFALRVAEGVLGAAPSEAVRQAGVQALAEAVDQLADGNPTTITLHPVDLLQHQESGFAAALDGAHALLRWEPDSALAPGDWVVATPDAAVRRITTEALATLRDRLGLDTP